MSQDLPWNFTEGYPGARPLLRRSLVIALLVGTILNLINQGDAIWNGSGPVWWKAILTYPVPLAVASFDSYSAFRASSSGGDPLH
jgi:methyl-accepting chemotaxis protein